MRGSGVIAVFVVALSASSAQAQCNFDLPTAAKKLRAEMVRAYEDCPAPNVTCSPTVSVSAYNFGESGRCSVKLAVNTVESCATVGNYLDEPCQTMRLQAKCDGVERPAGGGPIDGSADRGWTLSVAMRVTTDLYEAGDKTVVVLEQELSFSDPQNGSINVSYSAPADDGQLFGPPYRGAYFSPCSNVEILDVAITDPNGDVFAVPGLGTR
jgi:hypothetical protein